MINAYDRYQTATNSRIQNAILMLAIAHAHEVMNLHGTPDNVDVAKLQAKAVELLNHPETFRERLALSVVALLPEEAFEEGTLNTVNIEEIDLELALIDAFDALAGVTPLPVSRPSAPGKGGTA